jgi:hypothetical protein
MNNTKTKTNEQTVQERIVELVGTEPLTGYKFAQVWGALKGDRVREQQVYNYISKRLIKVGPDKRIAPETAVAFLTKRFVKDEAPAAE